MQTITTKYLGPTNTRGSRYVASNPDGKRVVISKDYALDTDKMHLKAALALCAKMGWHGELIGGWIGKSQYAFVFAEETVMRGRA